MIKKYLILSSVLITLLAFKSDKKAYQLFDEKGKEVNYSKLLEAAKEADVILFGELHDNPIDHWLEQELTKDLYSDKKENLILAAEMFESDDQIIVDEYLSGAVSEKTLKDEAKLWTNFPSDYKPLLDFAKNNKLRFIAANIPRRYANMVYSKGLEKLDSISREATRWIAPLPIQYDSTLTCYKDIFNQAKGHGGQNLPKSQAIKDATMAYFILKNFSTGKTLIHFNGSYHSDHHQGIEWYLKKSNPSIKVLTIGSTEQDNIEELNKENFDLANFILCTPTSMSKTYRT
ncbi:MAG TPA: ChaN family lipoprotein [Prolixibacteraceae bacterium]|nr:ChaN family lipoprotein [Prolixibacteraceae bacterium]